MPESNVVQVVHTHLRWEVRVRGITRPLVDWFCTKERALEHALERAREAGTRLILVDTGVWGQDEVVHL